MGTEAFWIPAALAAASAGGQYASSSAANSRASDAEAQAINNQMAMRSKANGQVQQLTRQIAQDTPQQIQGQQTQDFINTLRRNGAGAAQPGSATGAPTNYGASESALAPTPGGSSRYNADTASAQKQVQDFGNTNAGLLAGIDAPVQQRQLEGLGMQSTGVGLDTIGAQSYMQNFVDQLRAQQAGQQNPWLQYGSKLLGNMAASMAVNGVPYLGSTSGLKLGSQYLPGGMSAIPGA